MTLMSEFFTFFCSCYGRGRALGYMVQQMRASSCGSYGVRVGIEGHGEGRKPVVAVAMSGGVDSSVAALLLKRQGYKIFGLHMRNWDSQDENGTHVCPGDQDYEDARKVCRQLGIDLFQVDYHRRYWLDVFETFTQDFSLGRTPNPDLPCNQYIKFDALLEQALNMGADCLATGHYARLSQSHEGSWRLLRGIDRNKDQSYFLASVGQAAFQKVIFPLGFLLKSEVRQIATEAGLLCANRRSSAGICFVGRRRFSEFISGYVNMVPGLFVSVSDRVVLGKHIGLPAYTFGQRARIAGASEAWYVAGKDVKNNIVFVAQGSNHPALYCKSTSADSLFWISGQPPQDLQERGHLNCLFKARYGQAVRACSVALSDALPKESFTHRKFAPSKDGFRPSQFWCLENATDRISSKDNRSLLMAYFQSPAKAVTPGQALVLYSGDICLGGGLIRLPGQTLFEEEIISPLEYLQVRSNLRI